MDGSAFEWLEFAFLSLLRGLLLIAPFLIVFFLLRSLTQKPAGHGARGRSAGSGENADAEEYADLMENRTRGEWRERSGMPPENPGHSAASVFPAAQSAPADPSPAPPSSEPDPSPAPATAPEPVPEEQTAPRTEEADAETLLTPEAFAGRFFAKPFPGEAEKRDFEKLRGRTVEWTGTLKNSWAFSSDFIFGMKKGVRASIALDNPADSGGFGRKIMCCAAFAPEDEAALKAAAGKTIRFRGTLIGMEAVSREIRLDDAGLL